MKIDVSFSFAKVYDITKLDVVKGQKFTLLSDDENPNSKWFADNDPVLAISQNGNSADVEAANVGPSRILILNQYDEKVKEIAINVLDAIVEPAKDLNLTAGTPVPKNP